MNLVIDGNYILNRNVFSLVRDRLLYGHLSTTLENAVDTYSKWYPFKNVYFVSDSTTNWRKNIYPDYKGNRSKSDDIDWEFVYVTYQEFKEHLPKRVKLLEKDLIEGDDWFYYLCDHHNQKGESVLMVSNDGDLKQLLVTGKDFINIMVNENTLHNKIFLPQEYRTWMSIKYDSLPLPSLFDDVSEKYEEIDFISKLTNERKVEEVDPKYVVFEKLVAGDRGDNIKTVWGKPDKNGTIRGLGAKSAEKIYNMYLEYFGYPKFNQECFDRISDLIIEFKKLDHNEFDNINENIVFNNKLVNFNKIPNQIIDRIRQEYGRSVINK